MFSFRNTVFIHSNLLLKLRSWMCVITLYVSMPSKNSSNHWPILDKFNIGSFRCIFEKHNNFEISILYQVVVKWTNKKLYQHPYSKYRKSLEDINVSVFYTKNLRYSSINFKKWVHKKVGFCGYEFLYIYFLFYFAGELIESTAEIPSTSFSVLLCSVFLFQLFK